jgi:hypothetical protein
MYLKGFILIFMFHYVIGANITWIADRIFYNINDTSSLHRLNVNNQSNNIIEADFLVKIDSNGRFYEGSLNGNYQLLFSFHYPVTHANHTNSSIVFETSTNCIPAYATGPDVKNIIENTILPIGNREVTYMENYFRVQVSKYEQQSSTLRTQYNIKLYTINKLNFHIYAISIQTNRCEKARTIGLWNDASRWVQKRVPYSNDSIIIPVGAGVIQLTSNIRVKQLIVQDGLLIGASNQCPDNWTVSNDG